MVGRERLQDTPCALPFGLATLIQNRSGRFCQTLDHLTFNQVTLGIVLDTAELLLRKMVGRERFERSTT
jgi:hypothetical protein